MPMCGLSGINNDAPKARKQLKMPHGTKPGLASRKHIALGEAGARSDEAADRNYDFAAWLSSTLLGAHEVQCMRIRFP